MIMMLFVTLIMGLTTGGPASALGYFGYIACCLPFALDLLISLRGAGQSMRDEPEPTQGCTVEELNNPNQENFLSADESLAANGPKAKKEEEMVEPSQTVLPEFVQESESLYNIATSDWKENAAF